MLEPPERGAGSLKLEPEGQGCGRQCVTLSYVLRPWGSLRSHSLRSSWPPDSRQRDTLSPTLYFFAHSGRPNSGNRNSTPLRPCGSLLSSRTARFAHPWPPFRYVSVSYVRLPSFACPSGSSSSDPAPLSGGSSIQAPPLGGLERFSLPHIGGFLLELGGEGGQSVPKGGEGGLHCGLSLVFST
jgi:hypothetical protein